MPSESPKKYDLSDFMSVREIKLDDLSALRDKLRQTIDFIRKDIDLKNNSKNDLQHTSRSREFQASPRNKRAETAAFSNLKKGKKMRVPPLNLKSPKQGKEGDKKLSHRDNETYREYSNRNN